MINLETLRLGQMLAQGQSDFVVTTINSIMKEITAVDSTTFAEVHIDEADFDKYRLIDKPTAMRSQVAKYAEERKNFIESVVVAHQNWLNSSDE